MYKRLIVLIILILMLSFSFADLTTDLVSYYDFDEASGNLLDLTVNSKDLTNSNITYSQTGIIEDAYSFNGSSDKITISGEANFDAIESITGTWSISQWVKPTNFTNSMTLFAKTDTTAP